MGVTRGRYYVNMRWMEWHHGSGQLCSVALSTGVCMKTSVVYDNSHSDISSMQLTLYKWLLFNLLGDSHLMQLH